MLINFKRIADLRIDNDLTMKEIAKILDISVDNYYDYEHSRSNIPLNKLNLLVNHFKVSFDYITGLSDIKIFYNNNINHNVLKQRLKEIRKEHKLSQAKTALILGDRQSTYWNYEQGNSNISISKLYLLAKFYNISIDYFVGKTNNRQILTKETIKN